jgi:YD repeat-containing protein
MAEEQFFPSESAYNGGSGTSDERTTYKYDAFGRAVEVTQWVGTTSRTVENSYDVEGRLVEVSSPEGVIVYTYDAYGRKTATKLYPAGADPVTATPERVTSYTYDALDRLQSVSEDLDLASTVDQPLNTTYSYDLVGNLDRTDNPNGVITDYVSTT